MAQTIAILGATGKTGREVLQRLLHRQDVNIQIYVRSTSKLVALFPSLPSNPRVSIFQGPLGDVENMRKCLNGAEQIVFTLGENDNLPGVSVIEDGARTVVAALEALRDDQVGDWRRPRVLLLSSATWNPTLAAVRPALIHWAIKTAFVHPYADLRRGQEVFLTAAAAASSLVSVLLVQPNGLIEDEPSGHEISVDHATFSVTYGDLGAAFVDLACMREFDDLPAVGVSSKNGDNGLKYGPILGYRIVRGLCATYIPGFWHMHRLAMSVVATLSFKKKVQ
ncbi:uncharacterized protein Z520_09430 [Fonsecaea multimorphosa CBS 102226]|uniref:NAD(P)-binding domain-containing protein n=1 Tax=Fonsecaea multimorphosa CBS 102226 TaxID=1442371 RepID=A0A0D2GYW8_9EURO|nr:uncharacterized protein Z520_09430 [Fonsecaea multimorphosa CBS 102226]KIX94740.1 hypothetical protein Z520_09430 [Fonsecaea multimorphosa CBS 102226]OAL20515.1 hypothetical protein AYO22_08816 [Fonsecaea multimorphosa]